MKRLVIIAWIILCAVCNLKAQSVEKQIVRLSSGTIPNSISISTVKSYNTYHWNGSANFKSVLGSLYFNLNEQFISSLIRMDRSLITDQNSLNIQSRYRLSDVMAVAANVSSFTLSDNRSISGSISKASSHGFYGGVAYTPFDRLVIEPLIGARFDKQINKTDKGLSYLLGIELDTSTFSGYLTTFNGSFQYDNISPRALETDRAFLSIYKILSGQTANNLIIGFYKNRRDFYISADSSIREVYGVSYNIERRSDNILTISDSLRYDVSKKMLWTLQGNIFNRKINRSFRYKNISVPEESPLNTSIEELRMEGIVRTVFKIGSRISSMFTFSYLERDEKHIVDEDGIYLENRFLSKIRNEERKNNHSRRSNFAGSANFSVSNSDTIEISGSATILNYNTPSQDNDDDRDELWYLFNISSYHNINKHLKINISANIALTHLVYLFSSRSADNNWNRIIQLSPTIFYAPSDRFSSINTFGVLANYTVYDFEQVSSLTKSYSFRQFAFIDSSTLQLSKRFSIGWFNHIRLYERGEFRWDKFSEKPVNYFEDKLYHGTLRYRLTDGLHFTLGIRYFSQWRYGYQEKRKVLESKLISWGPTTTIQIYSGTTNLYLDGWYEIRNQTGQVIQSNAAMELTIGVRL